MLEPSGGGFGVLTEHRLWHRLWHRLFPTPNATEVGFGILVGPNISRYRVQKLGFETAFTSRPVAGSYRHRG